MKIKLKMPDYSKGKIYKLTCDNPELVYYGSTTQKLSYRLSTHRNSSYLTSKSLFEAGNVKIELIKNFPCNNKKELHSEEGKYIEQNICVNKQIPGKSREEKYKIISLQKKKWREENKEHQKKYMKKWKEKNDKYYSNYYNNNKTKIIEKYNQYRKDNIEKIKEYKKEKNKEKITCECGCVISYSCFNRHKKTKKHFEILKNKNEN